MTTLEELKNEVAACRKCPLADGRTQTVFGVGDTHARVMIIGEAPGKNEDLQGEPFVGAAGKYLNELLAIAGLTRDDVFIANVLKCRPPGNRDPRPEEIELCTPYLREQTRILNPEYIVTLGNFSTKFILKTEVGITQLHGRAQKRGRFTVFPIFHPAAAIYDRKKRTALEEDFTTLGRMLGTLAEDDEEPCEAAGGDDLAGENVASVAVGDEAEPETASGASVVQTKAAETEGAEAEAAVASAAEIAGSKGTISTAAKDY